MRADDDGDAQHSRTIAESAEELEQSSAQIETSADRTTRLAADRTILAAERTYASWVRTGDHAGDLQRVLFRRCDMAPPEPRSAAPGAKRAPYPRRSADRRQWVSGARFHCRSDRNLDGASLNLSQSSSPVVGWHMCSTALKNQKVQLTDRYCAARRQRCSY